MYLSGFHIDGFGIYCDQGVQDLPPGLVLFAGHNESGKTTLMEFLRTLLFGFPRRDKKRNDYNPLRGGNPGGRLQVIMRDGRPVTIERAGRQSATIAETRGTKVQVEPAVHLLGGLDRDTFNNVFAVGLTELQGLGVLSQEGVRGRLFSAGAGLGSASVPGVMKGLDKELANLAAQRGQTQTINVLIRRLKEIEAGLKELKGQASAYAEGRRQQEHLEERIEVNRQEVERLRRQLAKIDRLEQARLPWVNRNLAREKTGELAFARDFPVNGLERLESLDKELDKLRLVREARREEVNRLKEQLGGLSVDEAVLAQQEAIEALGSEREKLAAAKDDYPIVTSALEQARKDFQSKLRDLGPTWDASRLADVDTSVQVRQRVHEFGRQMEAAERRWERAQAQERAMDEAAAAAQKQHEAATQDLQALPVPPLHSVQELESQQEALRRLRTWFHQRELLTEKLRARECAREEAEARGEALSRQLAEPGAALPWWLGIPWLVLGLGLGGWFLYQRAYLQGGLISGVGLVLAGLFFWLSRRQAAAEDRCRVGLTLELEQVEGVRGSLSEDIATLEGQLEAASGEIVLAAQVMGKEPPGDAMLLEEIAGALEQAASRLRDWQARQQAKRQAEDHLAQARLRLDQTQAETAEASQDLEKVQDDWAAWLTARGFSEPVRPAGFEAVLQAVENARSADGVLRGHQRRLDLLSAYLVAAQGRILQVLAACERAPQSDEPGVEDLDALRRALNRAVAARQQQRELTGHLHAAARDLDILESQRQEYARERDELLRRAGAADPEDFRRRGEAYQQWRDRVQQVEGEEMALRRMAGTPEAQAALEEELNRTDPLELQGEKERLELRLRELTDAINVDNQAIGDLKGKLNSMEQDRRLGDLLFRQRTVQEQLTEAIRRWATLAICRHLLDKARGVYEQERQPQVIREADGFLNTMAHGRYRLLAAVGEEGVHLEDRSLARKEELTWSAGLADQVYLAIRLGLVREFSRHSEPLPVILDDVLVKFDPSRRENAARVILDFAREQQVLLFSCHPELMEVIRTVHREARHQKTAIASFAITDGIIAPLG